MANVLQCDIVTPDTMLFRGEAVLVGAPAAEGDIGLMYQCSPLMSTLRRGTIRIKSESDEVTTFAIDTGYLEVDGYKVVALVTHAIDIATADKSISQGIAEEYKKRLAELSEDDPARAFAQAEVDWHEYLISII